MSVIDYFSGTIKANLTNTNTFPSFPDHGLFGVPRAYQKRETIFKGNGQTT